METDEWSRGRESRAGETRMKEVEGGTRKKGVERRRDAQGAARCFALDGDFGQMADTLLISVRSLGRSIDEAGH